MLKIYATQSSGVALLNLPNSTYTASVGAGITFSADQGFASNNILSQISDTFNPTTASSPNFIQDSAHLSVWSLNVPSATTSSIRIADAGAVSNYIFTSYVDGNTYFAVNGANVAYAGQSSIGFLLGNRSGAAARQDYINGVSLGSGSAASGAVPNSAMFNTGNATEISNNMLIASVSVGGSLNATDQLNFYNRMRTYMTAVGVP